MVEITFFLKFSTALFLVSLIGVYNTRNNIILVLISLELMLVAVITNFVVFSVYLDNLSGQVFSLFILLVAASESSIALSLLVSYYRLRNTVRFDFLTSLKG